MTWHHQACVDVVIPMHDPIKSGPLQAREPFGEQVSFDEIYLKQQDPQYSKMCESSELVSPEAGSNKWRKCP